MVVSTFSLPFRPGWPRRYHIEFDPPEDETVAARLTARSDDTPELAVKRIGIYRYVQGVTEVGASQPVPRCG